MTCMMTNFKKYTLLVTTSLSLISCAVGEDYSKPLIPLPESWVESSNKVTAESKDQSNWWKNFGDAELDNLIEKAKAQNLDLAEAKERVKEARAIESGADANLLPQVNIGATADRSRNNGRSYEAGFDASWEVDIFGGNRRIAEATEYQTEAAVADADDVELSLLSEVARTYVELRLNERQLELAKQTLETQSNTARITEARYNEGVEGRLEVSRANSQAESIKAQVPLYESLAGASRYKLEFLLGQQPGSLKDEITPNKTIPLMDGLVATDIPVNVIARRPDIRTAERSLASATALTGSAIADMYPKLNLSAILGLENSSASDLFRSSSRVWSVGGSLLAPLFDFGRIQSNIDATESRQEQAFINYKRTTLAALQEVETAMLAYAKESERLESLTEAANSSRKAVEISQLQYKEGIISQLDVLEAQSTMYNAEAAQVQSTATVSYNLIALYKALGYGLPK